MGAINLSRGRRPAKRQWESLFVGSVHVEGHSIYYETSGVSEDSPTVLFLHECGGACATWHGQLIGLAADARCLVPDLPGHGRSEGSGYDTVQAYRRAIVGFLDALAIRWPVVVAGVCLGAAVAADLALHAPGRVAGLILAGVGPGSRASEHLRRAVQCGEAPDDFVDAQLGHTSFARVRQERLKQWRLTCPVVRGAALEALCRYDLAAALTLLKHRLLLVAGEEDRFATPNWAHSIARAHGRARVETIARAGCLSMLEAPEAFNRAVRSFLEDLACPPMPELGRPGGYRRFV